MNRRAHISRQTRLPSALLTSAGMLPRAAAAFRRASTLQLSAAAPRFAPRRAPFSSPSRQISFWPLRKTHTPLDVPVYFPRPATAPRLYAFRKRAGRLLFAAVSIYICWQIFATVVFDPLLDWADLEWDSLSEKEKKEMEELAEDDEPLLFLPFPFTTTEVKQPPYKGTDPEWLTFLAVNKDAQAQKDIKFGLAELIRRGVEKNPAYVRLLGGKDIKLKKLWLDIIYPPAPPPKHYVSGIIIDDDGIFWGDRPIDSVAASHLNKAIYPKAVALTVWTFVNSLCRQTAHDIARALGFNAEPSQDTLWQNAAIERMRQQRGLPGAAAGQEAIKSPGNAANSKPATVPVPSASGNSTGPPFNIDTQLDPRIQGALLDASMTLSKNWQPVKQVPNRGCIRVDGLVELQGKNALMAVYVLGWYDPKQKNYMAIQTGLKHLVQLKQNPAKG